MGYLRAKDTVNGALGTCFAIIDGKRHELMQVKNIQAKVKKTRMTIPILGMTAKQQKSGGWEGTGIPLVSPDIDPAVPEISVIVFFYARFHVQTQFPPALLCGTTASLTVLM